MDEIDIDIEEIDEELALPSDLVNLSLGAKKELLVFKRSHNERDWEEEILRRIEDLGKNKDYEMLKLMAKGAKSGGVVAAAPAAKKKVAAKTPVAKKRGRRAADSDSDEDYNETEKKKSKVDIVEDDDSVEDDFEDLDDDDDDELFDSDEEEEATNRVIKTSSKPEKVKKEEKAKPKPKAKVVKRSRLDSSDSESDYDSDDRVSGSRDREMYPPVSYDSDDSAKERRHRSRVEEEPVEDTSDPAELEDYIRLQVRRMFIEKWIQEPFFDAVMKKQFVRVYVGNNPNDDSAIYRMCEIVNVTQYRRQYKLMVGDSYMMTDKAINVSIGKSVITKKLDIVSNSRISQNELNRYLHDISKQTPSIKPMTKNEAINRRKRVNEILNHRYTNEEIKSLVTNRLGLSNFLTTEYSTAKERLEEKLAKAIAEEDDALRVKLQRELDKIETNYNLQKERNEMEAAKRVGLNKRNRMKNSKSDIQASVLRKAKEARQAEILESGGVKEGTLDPFRRREARPQIIWNTTGQLDKSAPIQEKENTKVASVRKVKKSQTNTGYSYFRDLNLDEIRDRVTARLGLNIDPIEHYAKTNEMCNNTTNSKRIKYLLEVRRELPLIDSKERETLRKGLKLSDIIQIEGEN